MSKTLNVAVVGLGYFSQFHLASWANIPETKLVGVTDPAPQRVSWAQETFGVPGFDDLGTLLRFCDPDMVDIVAPPHAHAELIRSLAQAGRTLICQKPFCTSLEEATAIAAHAEKLGCRLLIHENFRFQPWYRRVKRLLDAGELGQVYQCRFSLRPGDGRGENAYLARQPSFQKMQRFLIHETGVHFVDLFRWLFGEITSVYADVRRLNPAIAGEDTGLLILDHNSGMRSLFDGNRLSDHATDNPRRTMGEMVIEGEAGALRLDGYGQLHLRGFGQTGEKAVGLDARIDDNSFGGGCVAALNQHVVSAIRGQAPFENLALDYLPVIKATEAAYRSAETGYKINLDGV